MGFSITFPGAPLQDEFWFDLCCSWQEWLEKNDSQFAFVVDVFCCAASVKSDGERFILFYSIFGYPNIEF